VKTVEPVAEPAFDMRHNEGTVRPALEHAEADPAAEMAKIADTDRHLRVIGAEVVGLRDELARLREEAEERTKALAEREVVVAELSGLLPTLEEARINALRRAETASVALTGAEARVSEYAGRIVGLKQQLAAVTAASATHERTVVELETRLAAEQAKRDGTERALGEALAWTRSAERSLSEARARLEAVSVDHEGLLLEGKEEHAVEQRPEKTSTADRAPESHLSRETAHIDRLERERETLDVALARHLARLSDFEADLAHARREREAARAVAYVRLLSDKLLRARELAITEAAREASRRLADAFRAGSRESRTVRTRTRARALRQHPLTALPANARAISRGRDSGPPS